MFQDFSCHDEIEALGVESPAELFDVADHIDLRTGFDVDADVCRRMHRFDKAPSASVYIAGTNLEDSFARDVVAGQRAGHKINTRGTAH